MNIEYYAIDKSNNQAPKKILATYKDTTPPTITYRVENGYIDSDGTIVLGVDGKIIFTIEDDRALGKFFYRIDQGNWQEIPLQGKKQDVTLSL
jgi:hypothetical protein